MGKINLLDQSVYNRIAAGEVVERPASVVKELVENSIDAGATSISIEIKNGGIDYIRVADNGGGMLPEDVPLAFLPHATSKIKEVNDLDEIATLGFRGEALPSIASVAHVTLLTRTADSELGYGIELENGKILDQGDRGCPFGTSITVRDLFGNIPARKKFLGKPYIEQNEVSNIIMRFILANYNVAFKYVADGKVVHISDGRSMADALYAIYGQDVYENMVAISHAMSDISITGYIGKPYFTKHNRTYQTLIVNGRYVINADISYAVYECYADYLMTRQYPTYVLYLQLPNDMVDVNIHPNKLDVKFANLAFVKKIIKEGIRAALKTEEQVPQSLTVPESAESRVSRNEIASVAEDGPAVTQIIKSGFYTAPTLRESSQNNLFGMSQVASALFGNDTSETNSRIAAPQEEVLVSTDDYNGTEKIAVSESATMSLPYRIIGCLFRTYILIEASDFCYLIDQHAAHERLLFEQFFKQVESGDIAVQPLLLPFHYELSPTDLSAICMRAEEIRSMGIEFDTDTHGMSILAVPTMLANMDLQTFLTNLLRCLSDEQLAVGKLLRNALCQAACKAAVKGESELSQNELDILVRQLVASDVPMYCPHGRPIALRIAQRDLEKRFKRIV